MQFYHVNHNVLNLQQSIEFYEKQLGMQIVCNYEIADSTMKLVFMGFDEKRVLELGWLANHQLKTGDELTSTKHKNIWTTSPLS
jgi:catechol 2,3-dioxygenase-like lactoylglutathione lyase family enzyme